MLAGRQPGHVPVLPIGPAEPALKYTKEQIQAYTTVGGAPHLDGAYTVFGEVVDGMDVVEKIEKTGTNRADRPKVDIRILKASVVE